jgi:hypothetical protein
MLESRIEKKPYYKVVMGTWLELLLLFTSLSSGRKARFDRLGISQGEYILLLMAPALLVLMTILALKGTPVGTTGHLVPAALMLSAYFIGILVSAVLCVNRGKGIK